MWDKGLDYEVAQLAHGIADFLVLVDALANPLLHLLEVLLNANETEFTASLNQLIGLHHQRLQLAHQKHELSPGLC